MKELLANLLMAATDLHVSGAIRPEHAERFSVFRTALEQAHDQADAPPPAADDPKVVLQQIADDVAALREAAGV